MADFRKFFNFSVYEVGETVSFKEGYFLLESLLLEPGSRYFAKNNYWKYPESRIERSLLDLLDLTMALNWDSKKNGPVPKSPRPYNTDEKLANVKPISIERAKEIYKVKTTTKTQEEIKEFNRKFIEDTKGKLK